MRLDSQAKQIRHFIITKIAKHPENIVAITAKHFSVTRTTVHRHLNYLLKHGEIVKSGKTRNIRYSAKASFKRQMIYTIHPQLSEFSVLQKDFKDLFQQFPENINDICTYGFTEIFNNAIDHSKGTQITIETDYKNEQILISIKDNGIGIFQSLSDYFHFESAQESVLHLSKGKITTDPSKHTGEGIFFTSRAFDRFEIYANQLHYIRDNRENDWALETLNLKTVGSTLIMSIHQNSSATLIELFKQYQNPENQSFDKTEIIVKLSQWGDEPLISRSQAKRITFGLDKFHHILLDFSNVRLLGQGFVDEIFRVFMNTHPHITIDYINANSDVLFMIKRSCPGI